MPGGVETSLHNKQGEDRRKVRVIEGAASHFGSEQHSIERDVTTTSCSATLGMIRREWNGSPNSSHPFDGTEARPLCFVAEEDMFF